MNQRAQEYCFKKKTKGRKSREIAPLMIVPSMIIYVNFGMSTVFLIARLNSLHSSFTYITCLDVRYSYRNHTLCSLLRFTSQLAWYLNFLLSYIVHKLKEDNELHIKMFGLLHRRKTNLLVLNCRNNELSCYPISIIIYFF
jgi:hypothetical protein